MQGHQQQIILKQINEETPQRANIPTNKQKKKQKSCNFLLTQTKGDFCPDDIQTLIVHIEIRITVRPKGEQYTSEWLWK